MALPFPNTLFGQVYGQHVPSTPNLLWHLFRTHQDHGTWGFRCRVMWPKLHPVAIPNAVMVFQAARHSVAHGFQERN
jgi:hypothetical protein